VSPIFRKKIAWEEIDLFATLVTRLGFDPEKVFHLSIRRTAVQTLRPVE
jgi:hypothetical protein